MKVIFVPELTVLIHLRNDESGIHKTGKVYVTSSGAYPQKQVRTSCDCAATMTLRIFHFKEIPGSLQ